MLDSVFPGRDLSYGIKLNEWKGMERFYCETLFILLL